MLLVVERRQVGGFGAVRSERQRESNRGRTPPLPPPQHGGRAIPDARS